MVVHGSGILSLFLVESVYPHPGKGSVFAGHLGPYTVGSSPPLLLLSSLLFILLVPLDHHIKAWCFEISHFTRDCHRPAYTISAINYFILSLLIFLSWIPPDHRTPRHLEQRDFVNPPLRRMNAPTQPFFFPTNVPFFPSCPSLPAGRHAFFSFPFSLDSYPLGARATIMAVRRRFPHSVPSASSSERPCRGLIGPFFSSPQT